MKLNQVLLFTALLICVPSVFAASTGGALPWDTAIGTLSTSITGPWAYGVSIVALAMAFATLAFTSDLSGAGRTLVYLTIAIAGLVLVTSLVTTLFGGAASTSSIRTMQTLVVFLTLSLATVTASLQYLVWTYISRRNGRKVASVSPMQAATI